MNDEEGFSKYQNEFMTHAIKMRSLGLFRVQVSEGILTSRCSATRGLWATDQLILNHGQVTWTTPELPPPLLTTIPHPREDVSALDRFNVHRFPTRRVFSGIGLELVTRRDHSAMCVIGRILGIDDPDVE
ncbi:uncharacterized protein TNCV_785581 [Trichonephila clavipes]|nr:uncharacterized protein TNCV_785581 [Trichonephila clavipes]